MPHLPKLIAATAVALGLAFAAGQATAAPSPVASALTTKAGAKSALPVEKVHRYRYWRWDPATTIGDHSTITNPTITTGPIPITGTGIGAGPITAIGGKPQV
jgi:hypothetical protein